MWDKLLIIFPMILVVLIFWKSEIFKKNKFSSEAWNREQGKMLQAIACIGVILHHLTQVITEYGVMDKGPITILCSMGILFTSIFFFFSGFGLITSVYHKEDYLERFLLHRLPVVLVPFVTSNICYLLVRILYSKVPTTTSDIWAGVTGYRLLNSNAWYIVEIIFFYVAFYILFSSIRNKDVAMVLLSVFVVAFMKYCMSQGADPALVGTHWFMGEWWYNSTIVFVMGMVVARLKDKIINFAKKYYGRLLAITIVLFVISFAVEEYVLKTCGYHSNSMVIDGINNQMVTFYAQILLCIVFAWLILLLNMKLSIHNAVLKVVGSISLELYLIHGVFVNQIFDFKNGNSFLLYGAVFVFAAIGAVFLHGINVVILKILDWIQGQKKQDKKRVFVSVAEKRRRRKKVAMIAIVSIIILCGCALILDKIVRQPIEAKKEMQMLKQAKVGDEVLFGRYECDAMIPGKERVKWIVLQKNENRVMLLAKEGIEGSVYNRKHVQVEWQNADICHFLNEDMFAALFSNYEKKSVLKNPESGDYISLLSAKEAERLLKGDVDRQLTFLVSNAASKGTNVNEVSRVHQWDSKGYHASWWWLRGEGKSIFAPIVTVDGEIVTDKKYVNKPNGAVRPVVWVQYELMR